MFNDTEMGKEIHANEVLLNRVRVPSLKEELSRGRRYGRMDIAMLNSSMRSLQERICSTLYTMMSFTCVSSDCAQEMSSEEETCCTYTQAEK